MDGDSKFNDLKSQQNLSSIESNSTKECTQEKVSKDFELQNSKLAPIHNSSSSKESDEENITLRPETSKSFGEPENRLSNEHEQKRSSIETDEANLLKETYKWKSIKRFWSSKFQTGTWIIRLCKGS